jgi:Cu+-exporting ATPase
MGLFSRTPSSATKQQLKITGMHCVSCSLLIDAELEDMPGVHAAATNFARATTEVSFDQHQTTLADIKKTIQALGYDVDEQLS